ncbi:MAG: AI-2E family transporter [Cyclobacteriaceae bacterium]|nr:AI-2E family transporter [Cyclobacteriaceae bacterium]
MKITLPENRHLIILQYILFVSLILYFGSSLFIPLSFAILISCVLYPFCTLLERHKFGRMSAIVISLTVLTISIGLLVFLLINQLLGFFQELPEIKLKVAGTFEEISVWLSNNFNIERDTQLQWLNKTINDSGGNAMSFISNTISASAVGIVFVILIPIYVALILYYRQKWIDVLYRLFPNEGRERIMLIVKLSIQSYHNFIKGMAAVYIIVGILNSTGLFLLGIPHAFLFGFIAAVLTFIPYVGILVGALLPISMAWITYNSIWYPLGVIGIFAFVQYLEANLIFPLAVSSRLKINALVTIMAIFAGAIIWGVSGMILFIPFLGILKLIADRTPSLKTLSIILGEKKDSNPF